MFVLRVGLYWLLFKNILMRKKNILMDLYLIFCVDINF